MSTSGQGWGRSGLAFVTGMPDGNPDHSRAAVLVEAQRIADDIGAHLGYRIDAGEILTGRAAELGLRRRGRVSAGGATRLLAGTDGWCAITLSRPDDVDMVPALTESPRAETDPWVSVAAWVAGHDVAAIVARATLLGIPATALGEAAPADPRARSRGRATAARRVSGLLVADLSSMWAGPLCGHLLAQAGATVVKVESHRRPDGTRAGSPGFFDWMNHGKLSCAIDFDSDVAGLRELLQAADVVIEASRPAALTRRGCSSDDVAARPGQVWLRITGHGTDGENAHRVAFGDDAAVAGGLVGASASGPVFCGDEEALRLLDAAMVAATVIRGEVC